MMFVVFKMVFSCKKQLVFSYLLLMVQAVFFVTPAVAQQAIIDERQEGFKKMGAAMKTLNGELKKGAPDSAAVIDAAAIMAALAEEVPAWFPAGSGSESGLETDALAYIWKGTEKFEHLSEALITETKALVTLGSGSDFSATKKQLLVVRDNCAACHNSYRAD
jgi:cytochrome c556